MSPFLLEVERLKAENVTLRAQLAARQGKAVDLNSPEAQRAWAATTRQARELTDRQWEWHRLAAAELAAERRAAKPVVETPHSVGGFAEACADLP
jgi:hypothetical protein